MQYKVSGGLKDTICSQSYYSGNNVGNWHNTHEARPKCSHSEKQVTHGMGCASPSTSELADIQSPPKWKLTTQGFADNYLLTDVALSTLEATLKKLQVHAEACTSLLHFRASWDPVNMQLFQIHAVWNLVRGRICDLSMIPIYGRTFGEGSTLRRIWCPLWRVTSAS